MMNSCQSSAIALAFSPIFELFRAELGPCPNMGLPNEIFRSVRDRPSRLWGIGGFYIELWRRWATAIWPLITPLLSRGLFCLALPSYTSPCKYSIHSLQIKIDMSPASLLLLNDRLFWFPLSRIANVFLIVGFSWQLQRAGQADHSLRNKTQARPGSKVEQERHTPLAEEPEDKKLFVRAP